MSEEQKKAAAAAANAQSQPKTPSELESLKKRADTIGLAYPDDVEVDVLRALVNKALTPEVSDKPEVKAAAAAPEESEYDRQHRIHMRLIRCRIANLNPAKANVPGEVITFVNGVLGKVSKFIPFGEAGQNGYYIPSILVDELKARRFVQMRSVKRGQHTHEIVRRMVPEYSIEVLPDLTEEEMADLKARQHAAGSID